MCTIDNTEPCAVCIREFVSQTKLIIYAIWMVQTSQRMNKIWFICFARCRNYILLFYYFFIRFFAIFFLSSLSDCVRVFKGDQQQCLRKGNNSSLFWFWLSAKVKKTICRFSVNWKSCRRRVWHVRRKRFSTLFLNWAKAAMDRCSKQYTKKAVWWVSRTFAFDRKVC